MNFQTKSIFQLKKLQRRGRQMLRVGPMRMKVPRHPGRKEAVVIEIKRRNIFGKAKVDVLKRIRATSDRRIQNAMNVIVGHLAG